MPRILPEDHSYYTSTDPNNIVSAKKGALFVRRGNRFYFNPDGNSNDENWINLPYRTVIIPVPDIDKPIFYLHPNEAWIKNSDGLYNEQRELLPKTDWKFYTYDDLFLTIYTKKLRWFFPVPTNSYDPVGDSGNRSYDENFFYYKTASLWYRTPIHTYSTFTTDSGSVDIWYSQLPFIDSPRRYPPPNHVDTGPNGDQSYDHDFFYLKPSLWKRTPLDYFDPSKMAMF